MEENQVVSRILALCSSRGWSIYRLAKESNIAYSTLCTMIHKKNTPSLFTLNRICAGLGISVGEFMDPDSQRALLSQEELGCLSVFKELTPENRALSLQYMELLLRDQNR